MTGADVNYSVVGKGSVEINVFCPCIFLWEKWQNSCAKLSSSAPVTQLIPFYAFIFRKFTDLYYRPIKYPLGGGGKSCSSGSPTQQHILNCEHPCQICRLSQANVPQTKSKWRDNQLSCAKQQQRRIRGKSIPHHEEQRDGCRDSCSPMRSTTWNPHSDEVLEHGTAKSVATRDGEVWSSGLSFIRVCLS